MSENLILWVVNILILIIMMVGGSYFAYIIKTFKEKRIEMQTDQKESNIKLDEQREKIHSLELVIKSLPTSDTVDKALEIMIEGQKAILEKLEALGEKYTKVDKKLYNEKQLKLIIRDEIRNHCDGCKKNKDSKSKEDDD